MSQDDHHSLSIRAKVLGWSGLTTALCLIVMGRAADLIPDYGGPDGDGDGDDVVMGHVHGHAVYGGSPVPEAAGAVAVAAVIMLAFGAYAVFRWRKGKAYMVTTRNLMTIAGLLAMLALVVTPLGLTAALPGIAAVTGFLAVMGAGAYGVKRYQARRQPAAPDAPAWPPKVSMWPLPSDRQRSTGA